MSQHFAILNNRYHVENIIIADLDFIHQQYPNNAIPYDPETERVSPVQYDDTGTVVSGSEYESETGLFHSIGK